MRNKSGMRNIKKKWEEERNNGWRRKERNEKQKEEISEKKEKLKGNKNKKIECGREKQRKQRKSIFIRKKKSFNRCKDITLRDCDWITTFLPL